MKKTVFYITVIAIFAGLLAVTDVSAWEQRKIKCKNPEAQKLEDQLYDLMVADTSPQNYKKAIALMEKAVAIEPDNADLWVELSGDYWAYGDSLPKETSDQKKIRLAWFDKGLEAAKKSLAIKATAGGHFWLACNLASGGEMKGIMKSLWMFKDMSKNVEAANAIDPYYLYGASARFWSEVIARVPDIAVKASGMKPEDALADLQKQIDKFPLFLSNYVYMARYLDRLDRRDEGFEKLKFAISQDPKAIGNPVLYSDNVDAQKKARVLWKQWTGKDYPNK